MSCVLLPRCAELWGPYVVILLSLIPILEWYMGMALIYERAPKSHVIVRLALDVFIVLSSTNNQTHTNNTQKLTILVLVTSDW